VNVLPRCIYGRDVYHRRYVLYNNRVVMSEVVLDWSRKDPKYRVRCYQYPIDSDISQRIPFPSMERSHFDHELVVVDQTLYLLNLESLPAKLLEHLDPKRQTWISASLPGPPVYRDQLNVLHF
jgi:hypothetical protein